MALVLKDRVKEQSTTTGTGTLTLSGAFDGYQAFSVIGNGNVTYYTIYDPASGDWEVGYGTYTSSGTTLSRTFVYDSSNSGNLVDFVAGTKEVFCTYPAEQAIFQEVNGNLKLVGGVIGMTLDGTEGTTLPNTSFQAFTTGDYYMQANQQNLSSGAEASSDWVATADNGTDTENYIDVGMASSGYNFPDYSAQKPNSGYVLSTGSDLRLIAGKYGASVPGSQDIVLIAGSTKDTEERARIYGDTGNVNIGGGVNATDLGQKLQVVGSASISGAATFGSTVTLNADPSTALQAATKQYVDQQSSTGIHIHTPCTSETSAALSAVYVQGGTTFNITDITGTNTVVTSTTHGLSVNDEIWLYSTAGNGLSINTPYFVYATPTTTSLQLSTSYGGALLTGLTNASGLAYATRANSGVGAYLEASANQALPIAGVTTSDRVLVYQQATGSWNGVYTVTSLGSGSSKWKLTRATDANKYEPSNTLGMGAGDYFFIQSNSESYVLTNPTGPIIIGYDAITYTLFSSVPAYTGTSPIDITGTTISLTTVPATLGGTGTSTTTAGDLLYSATTNNWSKLSIGTSGYPLIVSGGLPAWGALDLAGAGVSGVLPESHGGTNQSSYATGDTLYASATNTLSKLSGNTSTTRKFMSQTGTGSASQAPTWDTVAASDITSGTLAVARGGTGLGSYAVGDLVYASGTGTLAGLADVATGNVLLSGGTNTAPSYGKVNLGTHIAGTLPTANGGTGLTSFTANGVVYASSTSALTTGSALTWNGSTFFANGTIQQGNGGAATIGKIWNDSGLYSIQSDYSNVLGLKLDSGTYTRFDINNSEQMRLTSTGLGIGTSSPSYKLDVAGQARIGGASGWVTGVGTAFLSGQPEIYSTSTTPLGIGTTGAAALHFYTNSVLQATLDSSGNLGLGVTPSAWNITASQVKNGAMWGVGTNDFGLSQNAYFNGGWKYISSTTPATLYAMTGGIHQWQIAPSGTAGNAISFTQAMTLDASGNLGIGVSSPLSKLHVNGIVRIDGGSPALLLNGTASTNYIQSFASGVVQWFIGSGGSSGIQVYTYTADPITFATNSSERMRIDSSGNLLVGTTSSLNPGVSVVTAVESAYSMRNSGAAAGKKWIIGCNTANSIEIYNQNSAGVYIADGASSWTAISDERTKDIIEPIADAANKVGSIRAIIGKYKSDETNTRRSFLIAQDVQAVLPEAISKAPNGMLGLAYSDVIPLLVAAIQELKAELDSLKAQIKGA